MVAITAPADLRPPLFESILISKSNSTFNTQWIKMLSATCCKHRHVQALGERLGCSEHQY